MRYLEESRPVAYVHGVRQNFVELLRAKAHDRPNQAAYVFLDNGEGESGRLSYFELDQRARAIAARLQAMDMAGERALLLYPQGLSYIEAFFGCLYAGVVAAPAYPPTRQHMQRLHGIMRDAAPALIMTTTELLPKLQASLMPAHNCVWLASDALNDDDAHAWQAIAPGANSLAFLQYTSGSTGDPKGVMVSHGNLLANQAAIKQSFNHNEHSTVVGWLPLYHDMGLIGNILQPLYIGSTAILMPPMAFLEKPLRWLQAISTYRATTSGGPNFAYDLCVRKISEEQKQGLDLSSWRLAFNGSEPVRRATLERFATAFAACGFQRKSFFPCYGMAETTLYVSGAADSLQDYAQGQFVSVSCGVTTAAHEVRIVDPNTQEDCPEGQEGEIWVAGPSVALGYWNRPEDSEALFRARINNTATDQTYLRTGDLGILQQGQLYISGRIKDLIIIRGRNYYPQDIEQAVTEALQWLRSGACVAFSLTDQDEEGLVVVAEITRDAMRLANYQEIFSSLRSVLADTCELVPIAMVLVPPGGVPKTTSGKLRRLACKQAYQEGTLPVLASTGQVEAPSPSYHADSVKTHQESKVVTNSDTLLLREALTALPPTQRAPLIARFLRSRIAALLKVAEASIPSNAPLAASGLDSLKRIELKHSADLLLGIDSALSLFMSDATLTEIAQSLAETAPDEAENYARTDSVTPQSFALSPAQQSIWAVQQRNLSSPVYNLQIALRINGELDFSIFQQSLEILLEKHAILRTVYGLDKDGVTQTVIASVDLPQWLSLIDASAWSEAQVQKDMTRLALMPFDLARGPILRVTLYCQQPQVHSLLLCVHHIAIDLWSVMQVMEELRVIYAGLADGQPPTVDAANDNYRAFVQWQRAYADSGKGAEDWNYWREQLAGTLPVLALPTDYLRPATPAYQGSSHGLHISSALAEKLRKLAEAQGTTPFTLLLAGYGVLLQRYTRQHEIIVGTATNGRAQARFAHCVGNCVNSLAIRMFLADAQTFVEHLNTLKETLRGALAHQDFPFSAVVERLQTERDADHWPIFQTWFVFRAAQSGVEQALASVTLEEQGKKLDWGLWTIEPIKLATRGETFDLTLMVAEQGNGYLASFHYRSDLFATETISRMALHFETLLEGIISNAEIRLSELPLLTPTEQQKLLIDWNATAAAQPPQPCLHELFEAQVVRTPQAVALIADNQSLSYAELNANANQLAAYLRAHGIVQETAVALCVERSVAMIVGILGILKAGAFYVPVDPAYPRERIAFLLDDCAAKILLTQAHLLETIPVQQYDSICLDRDWPLIAEYSALNSEINIAAANAAYLIYTSGSTGKPKGVLVSQANAAHSTFARFAYYEIPVERFLLLSSFAFDSSVAGIFWTLAQGGALLLPQEGLQKDPRALAETIAKQGISHLLCLPSLYGLLLEQTAILDSLRCVIVAGEPCSRDVASRHFSRQAQQPRLYNEYGPTEASVWSSAHEITLSDLQENRAIPIGRPITNARIYLLDACLNPVALGVVGELYIGGCGVTRGYLDRPDITAERFVPDPFSSAGERLYRSGDLARWRSTDANLEFCGRLDHQVKIRGFRIEPEEIEARLMEHVGIKQAVVMLREDAPGDKRLVAYVVALDLNDSAVVTNDALRRHLKQRLPDYMLPAAFVILAELPLTPNGKIDRNALPAPDAAAQLAHQYSEAGNAIEEILVGIWKDVLRLERVGIHDNFFELGGDSILSIQVASRAIDAGLDISPAHIFDYPTIVELAAAIRPSEQQVVHTETTATNFSPDQLSQDELAGFADKLNDIEQIYPLTPMQEGMLFHTLLEPGSGIYVMQDRFEIHGQIDPEVFRRAWQQVIDRHTALRTAYVWENRAKPLQVVYKQALLPFEYQDWSQLTALEEQSRLDAILAQELHEGIDLTVAPLLRVRLFALGDDRYRMAFTHHHIILDAWCNSTIFLEFKANYEALVEGRALPQTPSRPFSDYMAWLLARDKQAIEFWRGYLQGYVEPTPLVVDRKLAPEHVLKGSVRDAVTFLSQQDTEALNLLAQRNRLTINTFVQAALAVLFSRYAATPEVVFGVTVAGRPVELPDVESMLGLFINTLPLRVRIRPEQPLREFLPELLKQNVIQRQYEFLALTEIQGVSEIPRGQDIFRHMLTFENAPIDPSLREKKGTLHFVDVEVRTHTNYPITVMVIPGAQLHLQITYQDERFETATIELMLAHFRNLLEDMIHHPEKRVGELEMLTAMERQQIVNDWNRTEQAYPEPNDWVARFELQVEQTPDAIAISCQDTQLTYRQLNARANRLAHALIDKGVGPEVIVALLNDRGLGYATMLLAVFKAGAAYLPLDPSQPDARIVQVLEESHSGLLLIGECYAERAQALLTASHVATLYSMETLEAAESRIDNPVYRHRPENLAFVIFTSGSTGAPKGAMVEYRGMFNNLITKLPKLGLTAADVIAQTAGQCFDISVWQHLTALVCGGRVEIFLDDAVKEPKRLLQEIQARGVTLLEAVPSMIQVLLEMTEENALPKLRWLIACGEAFPPELCRRWMIRFPHIRVLNAYGPAECSDDVSYYEVPAPPAEMDTVVPVGRPSDNTRLYLLDTQLEPAPVGVPGEICITGIQVGRGYLHRPDLTAEKFLPDPFGAPGERLYRSGDVGRYSVDGNIEFLGRVDHQLKIRGFRIEPGEIEAQLLGFSGIEQTIVIARENAQGAKYLVAYVVCKETELEDAALADALRVHLSTRLPDYMLPAAFIRIAQMPLSANGKIDRKALPMPDISAQRQARYVAPRNPTEEILAEIWKEVLGLERVGVQDNFFDFGGHSLLAVQILSRVRAAFGVDIPFRKLFEAASIEQLVTVIENSLIEQLDDLSEEEAAALLAEDN